MPRLSTPQRVAGFRFATSTTVLPTRSAGAYHFLMPETTVLSSPPTSSVTFRSFLDFLTSSQAFTLASRRSTFMKSS